MKLLTFYSDSHKELYEEFFLESYNRLLKDSFELNARHINQLSKTGEYNAEGFSETMVEKLNHIIANIDITDDEPLVFADCDIQFFSDFSEDIKNELDDYDVKFQNDVVCRCAGFFVAKQSEEVLNFFRMMRELLLKNIKPGIDDQVILNSMINQNMDLGVKHGMLPNNKYFTVAASSTGPKQWNGEDFEVPKELLVHHGNWTVGLDNKFKLMRMVKNKMMINAD